MKKILDKITLKELLKAGAVQLENNFPIYEIGNQKYIVSKGIVIHKYYLDDSRLRRHEENLKQKIETSYKH